MTPHLDNEQPFAGRYELLEVLDSGGFANVWLAKHLRGGNQVALKIYAHQNDEGIESFRQEYAQFANLRHEALVNATDFDVVDNCPFLVMPYYSGGNAGRLVGQFTEANAAKLMAQVGGALAYLHAHNVVHQDVKPNNFLLDSDGNFLLSDLGLSLKTRATMLHPNNATTSLTTQKGSTPPCYRAPELFGNRNKIVQPIKATDTWAFGASLFELLTGDVPFGELGGIEQKADPSVPDMPNSVSDDLKKIITWCLDAETWGRPTAAKLAEWGRHFESTGVWLPQNDTFVAKKSDPTATTSAPQPPPQPTPQPVYNAPSAITTPVTPPSVSWPKWAAAAAVLLIGGVGVSKMSSKEVVAPPVSAIVAPQVLPLNQSQNQSLVATNTSNQSDAQKKQQAIIDKQTAEIAALKAKKEAANNQQIANSSNQNTYQAYQEPTKPREVEQRPVVPQPQRTSANLDFQEQQDGNGIYMTRMQNVGDETVISFYIPNKGETSKYGLSDKPFKLTVDGIVYEHQSMDTEPTQGFVDLPSGGKRFSIHYKRVPSEAKLVQIRERKQIFSSQYWHFSFNLSSR